MAPDWTSSLILGFLLALEFASGAPCRCLTTATPKPAVTCYALHGNCAVQALVSIFGENPKSGTDLFLYDTDVDALPDSFLEPYVVTGITLTRCTMTTIPHKLIDPTCPSLTSVNIFDSSISDLTIPAGGFQKCTGLKFLMIHNSGIRVVSSKAFLGLPGLTLLSLHGNRIQTLTSWEGIENVRLLDLSGNGIASVDKDAFRLLPRLTAVDLSDNNLTTLPDGIFDSFDGNKGAIAHLQGNPFHCNCSLKWLQDWVRTHSSSSIPPQCAVPISGPLMTFDFCTQTSISDGPLPEHQSPLTVSGLLELIKTKIY